MSSEQSYSPDQISTFEQGDLVLIKQMTIGPFAENPDVLRAIMTDAGFDYEKSLGRLKQLGAVEQVNLVTEYTEVLQYMKPRRDLENVTDLTWTESLWLQAKGELSRYWSNPEHYKHYTELRDRLTLSFRTFFIENYKED
jgi:hypothetical protein